MYKIDFISERNNDFVNVYYDTLGILKGKRPFYLYVYLSAIHSPAQRFYVSEEAAMRNIRLLEKGKRLPVSGESFQMYIEIHKRFKKILAHDCIPRIEAVRRVIYSPAPRFYFSVKTALRIISESRNYELCNGHRRKPAEA